MTWKQVMMYNAIIDYYDGFKIIDQYHSAKELEKIKRDKS